jgi:hypothetical protein
MASVLYVRSVARWVRDMDELHRRVVLEAFLFSMPPQRNSPSPQDLPSKSL